MRKLTPLTVVPIALSACLSVQSASSPHQETMAEWKAKGVRFTMDPPLGASGSRRAIITFTDPATSGGLVVELCQHLREGEENPCWVRK